MEKLKTNRALTKRKKLKVEMKRSQIIILVLMVSLIGEMGIFAQTLESQTDTGAISQILGDRVYVKGQLGSHVFEMISPCSWCEEGAPVVIIFGSFTRASMIPYPNTLQIAPVQMFIIKDGRQDNL